MSRSNDMGNSLTDRDVTTALEALKNIPTSEDPVTFYAPASWEGKYTKEEILEIVNQHPNVRFEDVQFSKGVIYEPK